jgi:modulator of FtsH protease
MNFEQIRTNTTADSLIASHVVLRNTYFLLSLTLLFSAVIAYWSMLSGAPPVGTLLFLVGAFGLLFLTTYLRNSVWGLVSTFAFTGFMGYTIGPMLSVVLKMANGPHIVSLSLGMTGIIFFSLSAMVLTTRKDFSFLSSFLFAGFIALMVAMVAGFIWHMPALYLAISVGIALFSSLFIIFETSQIIHGGQTNYIMATISLYMSLYNLFTSLLSIFGLMDRR